jgi:hypothetical protein
MRDWLDRVDTHVMCTYINIEKEPSVRTAPNYNSSHITEME